MEGNKEKNPAIVRLFCLAGFVGSERENFNSYHRRFGKISFCGFVGDDGKFTKNAAALCLFGIFNRISNKGRTGFEVTKSKILPQYQISLFAHFVLAGILLGSAFPKPCLCGFCRLSLPLSCGKRKEVITMPKRYNTPHRSRVIKTRLTEEEYADFTARLSPYGMSQSEFIRQAITRATIRPIVTVSPVNDELLAAVGKLTLPP